MGFGGFNAGFLGVCVDVYMLVYVCVCVFVC